MADCLITRVLCRRMLPGKLAACLLLVAPVGLASADPLLRWKWTAGEKLHYQFTQNTQTETAGAGKAMRIAIDTTMDVSWKVESVDAQGAADITQSIDRFQVTMRTDKLDPITYDSNSKEKSPAIGPVREIAEGVGKVIGATCRMHISSRGEITSVEPSEQLKLAIGSSAKSATGNSTTASLLTPDGMAQMLRQAAVILPEKAIAEGANWEASQETPTAVGRMLQRSQFTYAGVAEQEGAQLDKLTVATTFDLATGANTSPATKLKEGRQTGTLWFDSAKGRFVRSDLSQQLVTERPYRELTIRVQSASTLSMKLVTGAP